MLFTSGEFLFVYLPIVVFGFYGIAALFGSRVAAAWLVLASLVFYGFWRPEHTPLLLLSIAFNYFFGNLLQRSADGSTWPSKRALLFLAITVNLAVLAYFKYADFLIKSVETVGGIRLTHLDVLLPIGVSFFTFTQIAYLVDAYAGKVREQNPMHYALFVTYFPHLISGPVLHHAEMMPQFRRPETYVPRLRFFVLGLAFLVMGLAKKALVADSAAPVANSVFDAADISSLGTAAVWQGVLAYTLQIYFDFSGYSDMAVGLSLLIGVRLPYNFNSPYKARSIIDFWRRWHMTLSRFLRDYLYIALGGSRRGPRRRYWNLAVTMLLGGLWHGASWTFVVWGGLHGIFLMVNHLWCELRGRYGARWSNADKNAGARVLGNIAATVLTLGCVVIAWVFFRAKDFGRATDVLAAMFGLADAPQRVVISAVPSGVVWTWLALGFLAVLFPPNSQELIDGTLSRSLDRLEARRAWGEVVQGALIGTTAVAIGMLALVSASREVMEFIYFNF